MENRAVWGLSALGAKWAIWVFLVLNIIVMVVFIPMVYNKIEPLIHWRIREKVEVFMAATPVIVSGAILFITGFFSKKDEWRSSLKGIRVAMFVSFMAALISTITFMLFHSSIDWVRAYLLISTPIVLTLFPFLHSGFIAARDDKKRRRK